MTGTSGTAVGRAYVEKAQLTPEQKAAAKSNAARRGTKAGAYDNLRAAGKPMNDTVGKGVMPTLARRTALAGTGGRRIVTGDKVNARRIIGKADADTTIDEHKRQQVLARRQQRKGANQAGWGTVGMIGAHYMPIKYDERPGAKRGKWLLPHQQTAEIGRTMRVKEEVMQTGGGRSVGLKLSAKDRLKAGGRVARAKPAGAVFAGGAGLFAAGQARSARGGVRDRSHQRAINERRKQLKARKVEKFSVSGGFKAVKAKAPSMGQIKTGAQQGLGALKTGYAQGAGRATAISSPASKPLRAATQFGQMAGARPVSTGLIGGAIAGSVLTSRRNQMGKADVGKRRYDPETNRAHRQGMATATAGIGGSAALGYAGHQGYQDTKNLRRGLEGFQEGPMPKGGAAADHWRAQRHLAEQSKKLKNGTVIRGRTAAAGAGGLALLGSAANLHRKRNDSRWN